MKILSIVGTFLLLTLPSQISAQSVANIQDGVAFVRVLGPDGTLKDRGSGFLLSAQGHIMTAKHVLANYNPAQDRITVSLKSKASTPLPARRFSCDPEFDLCLLYVQSSNLSVVGVKDYFKFTCKDPEANELLIAAGYPIGEDSPMIVVPGVVSSTELGDGLRYYMTAPILPGMSGGPVFGKSGAVIGVVFGAAAGLPLSTFTPLAQSPELLDKAKVDCPVGEVKISMAPPAPSTQPSGGPGAPSANFEPLTNSNARPTTSQPSSVASRQSALQKIYIQVPNSDKKRAVETNVVKSLIAAGLPTEEVAEIVKNSPSQPEIRYTGNEKESAEKVKSALEASGPERFTIKRINGTSGVIEVWYPKA